MNTTPKEKTLQEKLIEIQQKLKVPKNQENKFGGFWYRSCEDILEALKPMLLDLSLIINDEIVNIGSRYYIKAVVCLSNGKENITTTAYAREPESKTKMDEAQVTGASSSYARKYALNGMFLIDDAKDADTMDNNVQTPTVAHKPTVATDQEHFCIIHNKPMKERTGKNGGKWFDHRWQNDAGEWQKCNGIQKKAEVEQVEEETPPFNYE